EAGESIDLTHGLPDGVTFEHAPGETGRLVIAQGNVCRGFKCNQDDSVIAIHKGDGMHKAKCHALAKKSNGRFSSIEEIEGKSLFDFFAKVERAKTATKRLKTVIAFANQCMTAVNE